MIKETASAMLADKIEKHIINEIGDLDSYIEKIVKNEIREAILYFLGIESAFGNYRFHSNSILKQALSEQVKEKALNIIKEGKLVEEINIPKNIKVSATREVQREFDVILKDMLSEEIAELARNKYKLINTDLLETLKKRTRLEEVLIQEL